MAVVAAVATAVVGTAVGGAVQAGKQHKAMRRARNEKEAARWKVEELQANRQEITNPFAGVQSLSSMASDLSGQMSNPYASLGVATQAAEIQMEQSDIALANSLDAMMATGASAGGATALAQAALRSKKGVAAGIEAQDKIRFERLVSRNQNKGDNKKSFEEFLTDEQKEADREIPLVIEKADVKINNDGDMDELYKQINNLIK